jgi:hypothetical protein
MVCQSRYEESPPAISVYKGRANGVTFEGTVRTMKMPGFTAEAALGQARRRRTCGARVAQRGRHVMPQLKGSVFHRPRSSGTFGTLEDYWVCKQGCETAYSSCLNTCEGTWGSPRGSTNCIICDQNHRACLAGCSGDIA